MKRFKHRLKLQPEGDGGDPSHERVRCDTL